MTINTPRAFIDYIRNSRFDYSSLRLWEIETLSCLLDRRRIGELKMVDTISLRATDNLQEDWTMATKIALLDEIERLQMELKQSRLRDASTMQTSELHALAASRRVE